MKQSIGKVYYPDETLTEDLPSYLLLCMETGGSTDWENSGRDSNPTFMAIATIDSGW